MKIIFTGGGSGGHIIPIIAVARELKKIVPNTRFTDKKGRIKEKTLRMYYIGPRDKFYDKELKKEGIKVYSIFSGKIRRYLNPISIFQNFFDLFFFIPLGLIQSFFLLLFIRPRCVFSKGGYGSFPVVFNSWIFRRKIFLHESDVVSGMTNKILSKFCQTVFTAFKETQDRGEFANKGVFIGNPVRYSIIRKDKISGCQYFGFNQSIKTILFLGGSQGAQYINDIVLEILEKMLSMYQVIHQCGSVNEKKVKREADVILKEENRNRYKLYGYLNEGELQNAYSSADLIISRAGAGNIFEIAANYMPSIIIPLPDSAQDHQCKNAYTYEKYGACVVIEQSNCSPHILLENMRQILQNSEEYVKMQQGAKDFSTPLAAQNIAKYLRDSLITNF
ncbi:MAG TPA: UDP-N-acetylglucosamine--N-acetylmuramyl-(pentapeptide) pyrophosphoryl-undecaprenol N-acetylglucosamine transferase [Candidatus Pacearchaeota archaeon]|nr:UDP-N-acetylglucosamine--N-acetylmuramyl-(pentapeptide) pyrophosphoryl-undecaprenol N-acetylglucosamine transferase [Candidatus Parcubacteria bacterium]HNZ84099.1 UDP-N-acetylglucosamine--N-acetylmuramyl-(pentapeptide) pyrophosphoryl-undecaprenol N-acetylglucosamine transferase [Candidatus Pacearchaeota archaeon]HOU45718.1 UDP-N-acetylglucosamine--N-acetylmuramyl-(pentapeptide) pyrophosphoryl-undecaprenol N-acetylglucosamine transferase [Candidatus Pacearchaeota archaeon]HPM08251.1 UDP-N-acet